MLRAIFKTATPWAKFWLSIGLVSLAAASAMSFDFGWGVSSKHAIFLACLSVVTAFLPHAAHNTWENGKKGAAMALAVASLPLFAIEFFSHAGYTAGLRGLNVSEASVQNVKYDNAQTAVDEDKRRLLWAEARLASLVQQNGWSASVTAEALRAKLASMNLAIEQEAARVRCAQKCLERTKERDEIASRIAILEERSTLQKQIDGTKALLDNAREKASAVEHKSSAVEHQNAFLTKAVSLTFNGKLDASPVLQETVQQAVNLGMALAGTGLPALAFFAFGLYKRPDEIEPVAPANPHVSHNVSREVVDAPAPIAAPRTHTINVHGDNDIWAAIDKALNSQKKIAA